MVCVVSIDIYLWDIGALKRVEGERHVPLWVYMMCVCVFCCLSWQSRQRTWKVVNFIKFIYKKEWKKWWMFGHSFGVYYIVHNESNTIRRDQCNKKQTHYINCYNILWYSMEVYRSFFVCLFTGVNWKFSCTKVILKCNDM